LNNLLRQTRGDRAIDPDELAPERTGSQVREVEGLSRRVAHALEGSIDVSVYCVDHDRIAHSLDIGEERVSRGWADDL
jgi:hypothetical protein